MLPNLSILIASICTSLALAAWLIDDLVARWPTRLFSRAGWTGWGWVLAALLMLVVPILPVQVIVVATWWGRRPLLAGERRRSRWGSGLQAVSSLTIGTAAVVILTPFLALFGVAVLQQGPGGVLDVLNVLAGEPLTITGYLLVGFALAPGALWMGMGAGGAALLALMVGIVLDWFGEDVEIGRQQRPESRLRRWAVGRTGVLMSLVVALLLAGSLTGWMAHELHHKTNGGASVEEMARWMTVPADTALERWEDTTTTPSP